ncbi:MAG: prepilin-type N-terminal cleavage/methylation domain-containing protein [Candidatus Omnitrophota bacterium]
MLQLHSNKGVTLAECIIAVALLGIALTVLLGAFTIGRTMSAGMSSRIIVINRLRETMEDIKGAAGFGAIASQNYPNWTIDDKGTVDVADDIVSTSFFSNVVLVNNCRRVTVTMQWIETRGGNPVNMQETLETYIANHWW